jgi:hypothetical protein
MIGISYILRNTLRSSQGPIQAYTQHVAANIGNELSNVIMKTEFNAFREEFILLRTLVETQRILILALSFNLENANRQLGQMSTESGGGGGRRRPKLPSPKKWDNSDPKYSYWSFKQDMDLYMSHEGYITDVQRITFFMLSLDGSPKTYMRNWSIGLKDGQATGTFTEFLKELEGIYGDKDEKEGARKELKILFGTKNLSNTGIPKFI